MKWLTDSEVLDFEASEDFLDEITDLINIGELKLTEQALLTILEFVND